MKKILVPCDFSIQAIQAYKFAMSIAAVSKGEVLVLKVIDLPFLYESAFGVQPAWHDPSVEKEFESQFKGYYEKMKQMYADVSAPVSFLIARGAVTLTVLKVIEEQHIDLVVMGTQGAGGSELFSMGTNTERILRSSPVPVISLRKATGISSIKSIVFPTTLELNQMELILKIKSLQDFFNATLHVLLINTPLNFYNDKNAFDALEDFAKHYKLQNYILKIRNDVYELEGIINYSYEVEADMIAIGTHGRKGISHILYGSVAEDVVNRADYPVWISALKK